MSVPQEQPVQAGVSEAVEPAAQAPAVAANPASPATTGWIAQREFGSLRALRAMRWFALAAGRPLARCLLHPITLYFLLAHGKARRASARYLERALQRPVRWVDTYRHMHRFAATVLDRLYLLQERFDAFDVTMRGADVLEAALADGNGAILIGAHFGSFEALRASAHGRSTNIAMLMYEDNARLMNATLAAVAPNAKLHTIALGRPGAMLALRCWLDDGGLAGLLADRTLPTRSGRSRTWQIDFLGTPASFSDGAFRLAAMLRRQVVFMVGLYHGANRYELRYVALADFRPQAAGGEAPLDARVLDALRRYVALLEALCRESPCNWFNFFDYWNDDADAPPAATPDARR